MLQSVTNSSNRSPTSHTCHQHKLSPTSRCSLVYSSCQQHHTLSVDVDDRLFLSPNCQQADHVYFRFDKPKSFEIDKSASTEDDDVFEEEESPSIPLKDLFLLQLHDEQNLLVFYSNGRKAISKTSNGYIALFDNVSSIFRVGFGSRPEIGRSYI